MSKRRLAILFSLLLSAVAANADEGMWMPSQLPALSGELRAAGIELDPAVLADMTGDPLGAIVSLGGCSASFVSPQGLIVTNHHCVDGYLQYNSTPDNDLLEQGFLARSIEAEVAAAPDARVYVTRSIEDVSDGILRGIERVAVGKRARELERRQKEMIRACERPGGLRCQVAGFFEDSQFFRITQTEIRDVRLVYAPSRSVGNFGGEVDNWMWPRHTGDFAFLRAYVGKDGKPADFSPQNVPYQPKHVLKIALSDLDPGDFVMVAGYPGRTYRYRLAEEVRDAQEFAIPASIRYREELIAILEKENSRGREVEIRNASRLRGLYNYLKKHRGTLEDFRESALLESRIAEEAKLDNPAVRQEIEALNAVVRSTRERDTLLSWLYEASPMLSQADTLYHLSRQRARKDPDRDAGYQDRDLAKLRASVARQQRRIEPLSDRAGLRHFLLLAAKLPPEQRIAPLDRLFSRVGGATAAEQVNRFLDGLYTGTRVGDLQARDAMFGETTTALMARGDSMIQFAAALRQLRDANEDRDREIRGSMLLLRPRYVAALKKVRGAIYPDANGTLRVSFGKVQGYSPRDGLTYNAQTTIDGILEKTSSLPPFDTPVHLAEMALRRDFGACADPDLGTVPVAFLSTNDITNGSSGSATLNARGELVGLAFDGNYEAMGSDYVVDPRVARTIHVDARYILWVLHKVDGANRLAVEMELPEHYQH
jgi:hypothetical protein